MNPDEDEPKPEGEPAPEPRAEDVAPQPKIVESQEETPSEAAAEPFVEDSPLETNAVPAPIEIAAEQEAAPMQADEPSPEAIFGPEHAPPEPETDLVKAYEPPPEPEYVEPDPPAPAHEPPAPPIAYDPPPSVHEAAADELHEEPLAEIAPTYPPQLEPEPEPESAFAQEDYLFGEPEIPMPEPPPRPGDRQRRRDAKRNLDLDLGRIKRRKRYGLFITSISVLFIAFVLAPVTWVTAYLFFDPPANVLMMQRAAEGETIRHYPVPLNRISPHIVRAVIAAEDANFCTHDGFDIEAIQDAMARNSRGGRTRGASTVSQQVAKNLFLWPERSWVRKGFETYFTSLIEFMWPKRRIMEAYLNTAEWGDGHFGVEAAARARFGVSAADLTPLQAARLAAVLPSPNRWRADNPGPYVRGRAASIAGRARVVRNERMAACVLALDRAD